MFPFVPLGRSLLPGPRRVSRLAAALRLALRLSVRRLQELGAGSEGRRIRHGPRLRPAARAGHRREPALPAGPSRRHAPLRHALRASSRPRGVVRRAEQRGTHGRGRNGRRSGQLPRDDQRPCGLQRLCHQRRALRHGQGERHVREHRPQIPHFAAQPAQVQRSERQAGAARAGRDGLHRAQEEALDRQLPAPHRAPGRNGLLRRPVLRHPHAVDRKAQQAQARRGAGTGTPRYGSNKNRHTDLWKQPR